jgi:regulator-associated protein of mTOR
MPSFKLYDQADCIFSLLWQAWDMALDLCLQQLPLEGNGDNFQHCSFFAEQLTAFQVWLMYGFEHRPAPEQLPIVLQVQTC